MACESIVKQPKSCISLVV